MGSRTVLDSGIVADSMRELLVEMRQSFSFLPALRKPAIAWYWIRTSRRAHLALAMSAVTLLLLLPPVLEHGLAQLFPGRVVAQETLTGLPHPTVEDPRADARARLLLALAWAAAGASVGVLFFLHLPVAVARSASVARALEQCADSERAQSPVRAILLYREALDLTADPGQEASIRAKMRNLQGPKGPGRPYAPVVDSPASAGLSSES